MSKASFKITAVILVLLLLLGAFAAKPQMLGLDFWMEKSLGVKRIVEKEETGAQGSALKSRIFADWYNLDLYRWQGIRLPFIGAGFHAAVQTHPDGYQDWRHSHGIHNCYLFAIEQGGLGAFVFFIWFLITCHKELKNIRKTATNETDKAFALGMHSFYYALLPTMLGGQIFWQGFNTVNFNTYLVMLFCMATMRSNSFENEQEYAFVDNAEYQQYAY